MFLLQLGIEPLKNRVNHLVDALRHDRIDPLDKMTDIPARVALEDRFSEIFARQAHGEECNRDAE